MRLAAITSSTGSSVSENAERVADPVQEQRADADAALDDAALARARLRHAQMQRMIRPLREHPIRLDRERHGRSLDGDDDEHAI